MSLISLHITRPLISLCIQRGLRIEGPMGANSFLISKKKEGGDWLIGEIFWQEYRCNVISIPI